MCAAATAQCSGLGDAGEDLDGARHGLRVDHALPHADEVVEPGVLVVLALHQHHQQLASHFLAVALDADGPSAESTRISAPFSVEITPRALGSMAPSPRRVGWLDQVMAPL